MFPRAREVLPPPEGRADCGYDSNGAKSNAKACWIWNSRWVRILPLSERRFHHCNHGKEEDIRMLLGKEASKASIAKILDVSRSALYHFIKTRKIVPD